MTSPQSGTVDAVGGRPPQHEHRPTKVLAKQVFMVSGPGPAGRPGMTASFLSQFPDSLLHGGDDNARSGIELGRQTRCGPPASMQVGLPEETCRHRAPGPPPLAEPPQLQL